MIWTLFGQFFDATVGQMLTALGGPRPMNRSSPPWGGVPPSALPPAPSAGGSAGGVSSSPAAWQPVGSSVTVVVERQESQIASSPKDLDDDAIKLVKYALVSIRRCHEKVLYGGVILVTTQMTSTSFASWIVALYLQSKEYRDAVARDRANEITHDDKKYLRVSWGVLTRYPRQPKSGCGTGKLDALKGIRDALRGFRLPPPAAEAPAEVASAEATLSTAGEIPAQGTVRAAAPPAPRPPRPRRPRVSAPAPEEPPPAPQPRPRRRRPGPPRRRPR